MFSKYFHWVSKMGSLSTYRFLVLRLINVLLEFYKNEDRLGDTLSYQKYFDKGILNKDIKKNSNFKI